MIILASFANTFSSDGFHDEFNNNDEAANDDKCFGCGEPGCVIAW